ncbi:hypothetical protein Marpi_1403 [Marinitoga piezophila KA3]|uniref:Uncharacterized protein n=1 Tax=Marinitoga piezophila (strain DSM 14283 / JCM 11233 / KA3) TaxID=443254 RepID=H2J3R0_MARPK|nr:hypothetical protein [Marinitoga piezophila]AEX85802.1 hypothetical protein Marpi_1403 [Marinitoga piezophila KA3]
MDILYITLMTLISVSWDRWFGDILFFTFGIVFLIVQYTKPEKLIFFSFLYSIIYFSSKYDIGGMTIIFFLITIASGKLLEFLEKSFFRSIISTLPPLFFLALLNKNFYTLIISYILIAIAHFIITGRVGKNERITL